MASTQKVSANLKLLDSKKHSIRKAILTVALKWKELDEQLDSIDDQLEGCLGELECRETNLDLIQESVIESHRELDSIRKSIEARVEEVERKEGEFRSLRESYDKELELKEKELGEVRRLVDERVEEVEVREERLNEQRVLMEGLLERIEAEKKQLEPIQKSIVQRLEEMSEKEKHLEGRARELESMRKSNEEKAVEIDHARHLNEERAKEVESMRKSNEERAEKLDSKEKRINQSFKDFDAKNKQLKLDQELFEERRKELESMRKSNEEREREIDAAQKLSEVRAEKLESREKQLNSVENYVNQSFEDFNSKSKQLKLDQKLFEERSKELERKEKRLEERSKVLELKMKLFDGVNPHVKVEKEQDKPIAKNASKSLSGDIKIIVTMDGRNLQMLVNERWNDHESMSSEVYRALQLSSDPAKLILDAMEGFYPPHLKMGDVELEGDVVRRSCIFLLEQLMGMSSQIQPCVREEALRLAGEWKGKMGAAPSNYLEVLGFIQLLASYKLASSFDTNEVMKLFVVVAEHKQAPELCRVLGFAEEVPDFIKRLVERAEHLVAIKYIYAFDLVDKFPPTSLLKSYLSRAKEEAYNIRKEGHDSPQAQDKATKKEMDALNAAIKCIMLHGLESQLSPLILDARVGQLLRQMAERRRDAAPPDAKAHPPKEVDKSMQSCSSEDGKKRVALDHDSDTQSQQNPAKKLCQEAVSPWSVTDNSVSSTCHIPSIQQPFQHPPAVFAAETAPHLRTYPGHYPLSGASPPVSALHMSHLALQCASGTPASEGFPPFGLASNQFGSAPNLNARPSMVAGTHYSGSVPNQTGLGDFRL